MVCIHKITKKDRNEKPRENELGKIRHLKDLFCSSDYKNEFAYNTKNKEQYDPYRGVNEVEKKTLIAD